MRILKIINDLENTNKYLSIAYFIDKYSVSKRTLQNDFSYLSKVSSNKGFKIIQKSIYFRFHVKLLYSLNKSL